MPGVSTFYHWVMLSQNTFHDLAVGIDAYDTELSINRNCRFSRNSAWGVYDINL
jgi:hypothetical protein